MEYPAPISPPPMEGIASAQQSGAMQIVRTQHVYIVEDSAPVRARLAESLANLEGVLLVGEAASAGEAIAGILRTRPDTVLLDLYLRGRTGLEVLRAVHASHPEIAFVVLTNHSDSQYRRACLDAGAAYFLDKSRDFERVPAVIGEIAASHPEIQQ